MEPADGLDLAGSGSEGEVNDALSDTIIHVIIGSEGGKIENADGSA